MALTLELNTAVGSTVFHGNSVVALDRGSLADELGLRVGDRIMAINGHPLRDIIDFRYYAAVEHLTLDIERDGVPRAVHLEKHPDEIGRAHV